MEQASGIRSTWIIRLDLHLASRSSAVNSSIITPLSMMPYRVASLESSPRIWLEIKTVMPCSWFSFWISSRISLMPVGSKPLVGSSKNRKSGSPIKAIAIAKRCFMPREKFFAFFLPVLSNPTVLKIRSITERSLTPCSLHWATRFCLAVI